MTVQQFETYLRELLEKAPAMFLFVVALVEALIARQTAGPAVPASDDRKHHVDFSDEDGTGKHTLTTVGISDEQKAAIRSGTASGIVKEKALEWVKGAAFAIGFLNRGGAA